MRALVLTNEKSTAPPLPDRRVASGGPAIVNVPHHPTLNALAFSLALAASACTGKIVEPYGNSPSGPGRDPPHGTGATTGAGGPAVGSGGSTGGSSSDTVGGGPAGGGGGTSSGGSAPADVNRVAIHRLNNAEYDNTVSDLLGVTSKVGSTFIDDEKLFGFDNIAAAFGMSDARYEQYFDAADTLVEEAFANEGLRRKILICTPASGSDLACAEEILAAFTLRAFRRPATEPELERSLSVVSAALELGEDFTGALKNALKALLSSASFLYRIELDPEPASTEPRRLNGYELASRLSYLVWSTMPDEGLLELAKSGDLTSEDVLVEQLSRLLADSRSRRFIESFGGQWLGLRQLESHQVDSSEYPDWNAKLREAMVAEGLAYFTEFLQGERGISEFFTADVNFVNAPLADLYGLSPREGDELTRVTDTSDERRGFLGLASFLTLTSFSKRTAPTLRGLWVLENLLCTHVDPPPMAVPDLETASGSGEASDNVRERLEAHRSNAGCAGCHQILDPIGLGLENFDAIGRYRETYAGGDLVDAAGELPSGEKFNGLFELSSLLAEDERLADCVVKKLMTYALSREIVASDATYVHAIKDAWTADGQGLAALLERIVTHDAFRSRRGEP
jgi:hypothetical protein